MIPVHYHSLTIRAQMSIDQRTWKTKDGMHTAYVVRYSLTERDKRGKHKRAIKTFRTKKEAREFEASVRVDVAKGVHVPASRSITVADAAQDWLDGVRANGRERTTIDVYEQQLRLHIVPRIGHVRLAELSSPAVERFRDGLVNDLSRPMARRVLGSLKMLLKDAMRRGNVAFNAAAASRVETDARQKRKLAAGRDFPTIPEVGRIIAAAPDDKARALLMVAAFAGLRSSELRGLRWQDVNLEKLTITVEQRADRHRVFGAPKSASGHRTILIGPILVNTLRLLKLSTTGDLVFGTQKGTPKHHNHLQFRYWHAAQIKAFGSVKYSGLHALRHFAASWMLHRREDGGLGLSLKETQTRLGHATLAMTADTYGHLLPTEDDSDKLAAAERHLFAV
jgi:integrase